MLLIKEKEYDIFLNNFFCDQETEQLKSENSYLLGHAAPYRFERGCYIYKCERHLAGF